MSWYSGNPNIEIRNPKQIRNSKGRGENGSRFARFGFVPFPHSQFELVSDFGFRILELKAVIKLHRRLQGHFGFFEQSIDGPPSGRIRFKMDELLPLWPGRVRHVRLALVITSSGGMLQAKSLPPRFVSERKMAERGEGSITICICGAHRLRIYVHSRFSGLAP